MKDLILKPTPKTLEVSCAPGEISLSGNSILSDPKVFFDPIHTWVKEYIKDPEESTLVNMKLEYVDTASVQQILEMMVTLRKLTLNEHALAVNWYYEVDDPELLELGEIMQNRLDLEFQFIKY